MRSRFLKTTVLVVVFSFSLGAWWSFYRHEQRIAHNPHGPEIRLLVLKNFLPGPLIKTIQRRLSADLQVTEEPAEIDLLRELLSHSDNYDIVELPSFVMHSFLIKNVLSPINGKTIPSMKQISIDFQHLDFDPGGKYFIPVSWGVSGFLFNPARAKWDGDSLMTLFNVESGGNGSSPALQQPRAKISLMDSPIEFLNLITKIQPIVSTWAKTDQTTELTKTVHAFAGQISALTNDPTSLLTNGSVTVAQISSGRAATFLKKHPDYKFVLPKEKGVLWVNYLAVSHAVGDIELANELLNAFLRPSINRQLVELDHSASVLNSLNSSSLPEMQKASYIRKLPLNRFELYVNPEAIEPTWLSIYQNAANTSGARP